jgi:hypothetical protein
MGEIMLRISLCVFFVCLGSIPVVATSEPSSEDIRETHSSPENAVSEEVSAEDSSSQSDERSDTIGWEHSTDAMLRALNYASRKLERKFPSQGMRRGKGIRTIVHHQVAIELIQNVTPGGLNTPDFKAQSNQFYLQPQNGRIAVFVIKAKIIRTQGQDLGALSQLRTLMQRTGLSQSETQGGSVSKKQKAFERVYLLSIPQQPFTRASHNPFFNPISQAAFKAGGMEMKQPEVPDQKIKALFPTTRPRMKKIKESQLERLLSGEMETAAQEEE